MRISSQFAAGHEVEIYCNEDGFFGSYFEAKIITKLSNNKYLVEYKNLIREDDENKKLREVVEASKVRPVPPKIKQSHYELLDVVDAYDGEVWWVGRITRMDEFNYYVYFESCDEEFAYSIDRLRIHQEYENGSWIIGWRKEIVPLELLFPSHDFTEEEGEEDMLS